MQAACQTRPEEAGGPAWSACKASYQIRFYGKKNLLELPPVSGGIEKGCSNRVQEKTRSWAVTWCRKKKGRLVGRPF